MKSKKKLLALAVVVLCLSVLAQSTGAFLVRSDTARNVITTSRIEIDLREMSGQSAFVDQYQVLPSQSFEKTVTVQNTGPQSAYVRIRLNRSFTGATGQTDPSLIGLDINTTEWTEKDGYYYYNEALAPNEETVPLFTRVTFSESMGNQYQGSRFLLEVTAEATQVVHNGEDVFAARGWPT